ncbi:hypothetical protein RSOLAG1IB_01834 [Rhizoctonia solani AG-1 IB]|uniref:Uncharacterized protein n=1 Tax=Thanatephorus cucumeris (strain AG1-IB / isolate 7/3/14) TaxID=1108050 RepID=A0A0B7FI16_THACB|nr:hypothetical protein RSOLAG1IB_01834 [Rhizoctonia solani AG-1 IB]
MLECERRGTVISDQKKRCCANLVPCGKSSAVVLFSELISHGSFRVSYQIRYCVSQQAKRSTRIKETCTA